MTARRQVLWVGGAGVAVAAILWIASRVCQCGGEYSNREPSPPCPTSKLSTLSSEDFATRLNQQKDFVENDLTAKPDFSHLRLTADQVRQMQKLQLDAEKGNQQPPMSRANLAFSALESLDLSGLNFRNADLTCASLARANLKGASFEDATLDGARLRDLVNADDASFRRAHMSGADFSRSRLKGSHFDGAKSLNGASFALADVTDATFAAADLTRAGWSPISNPVVATIANAKGLESLVPFPLEEHEEPSFSGLGLLRTALRTQGEDEAKKRVTKAYEAAQTKSLWSRSHSWGLNGWGNFFVALWRCVAWGALTDYGLSPWRPLPALLVVAILFTPVYWLAIPTGARPGSSLFRVRRKGAINENGGIAPDDAIQAVEAGRPGQRLLAAFRASCDATLTVGFGDVKLGEWIARLRRSEEEMATVGWLRTVAGIQSLVATLIFVIWAWSIFGDPFE